MLTAIYCPGPSLQTLVARGDITKYHGDYDLTIAVNTAIKLVTCMWLSAGDISLYRGVLGDARPSCGILTMGATSELLRDDPDWTGIRYRTWNSVRLIADHKTRGRPLNWSLQAALCFAADLGATHIDIYGCDLAGVTDASGYRGEDRSEDRWLREARDLQFTRDLLAAAGVTTTRHHQ